MRRLAVGLSTSIFALWLVSCGDDDAKRAVSAEGGAGGEAGEAPAPGGGAGEPSASAGSPSAGEGGAPGSYCPTPTNGPTEIDADVTEETTWTADGSPYLLQNDINVRAPLVLEPCVEVLIPPDHVILVRDEGSIEGIGTALRPIHIGASDTDPWGDIRSYGRPITLAYTWIDGGGELGNAVPAAEAMIDAQGEDGTLPTQEILSFDHVTVDGSASQGILLRDGAGFSADSSDVSVTGSATYPVALWGRAVGTLPTGIFTGNGTDAIFIIGSDAGQQAIQEDATMFNRGVPYDIGSPGVSATLRVGAAPPAEPPLLTIEPGVTLRFYAGGLLTVGSSLAPVGALSALGTDDEPITFTSAAADPAAGDWLGIYLFDQPDARTAFDHVVVEYAGGSSQAGSSSCPYAALIPPDAAIRFMAEAPLGEIVTNSLIRESAGHGIDRGWLGAEIDYAETNTFEAIASCIQTLPHPDPGICPAAPPCDPAP